MSRIPYLPLAVVVVGVLMITALPVGSEDSDRYPVRVEEVDGVTESTVSYQNLSTDSQQLFDRARNSNETVYINGSTNIPPEFDNIANSTSIESEELVIVQNGTQYLMEVAPTAAASGMGDLHRGISTGLAYVAIALGTVIAGLATANRPRTVQTDAVLGVYAAVTIAIFMLAMVTPQRLIDSQALLLPLSIASIVGGVAFTGKRIWTRVTG